MKQKLTRVSRICIAAGLGLAVFAGVADAAQHMSSRQCRADWRANKATYRSQGQTRRKFIRQCRMGAPRPAAPATTTH